eukprot:5738001-Pleurochrysis_carterae.AAC.2
MSLFKSCQALHLRRTRKHLLGEECWPSNPASSSCISHVLNGRANFVRYMFHVGLGVEKTVRL